MVRHSVGGGRFVAVGEDGTAAYSTDGETWTKGNNVPNVRQANYVAYGGGKFIAVGYSNESPFSSIAKIAVSNDGINWAPQATLDHGDRIAFGDGTFIISPSNLKSAYYIRDFEVALSFNADGSVSWKR
jgi:hypothetical protein